MSKIIDSLVDETEEFLSDKKLARRQRCFDSNLNRLFMGMGLSKQLKEDIKDGLMPDLYE